MKKSYRLAAIGGTFDHFHLGHQKLITTALKFAEKLIIGVSDPSFSQVKTFGQSIESYLVRRQNILKYLAQIGATKNTKIVPLHDLYGPTLTQKDIDLLVVSQQTLKGAKLINQKRLGLNLPPLTVKIISMVQADNHQPITSSQIRQGIISPTGVVYSKNLNQSLTLSSPMRTFAAKPFGRILKQISLPKLKSALDQSLPIIIVGDAVTQYFIIHSLPFTHSLIDHQIGRRQTTYVYSFLQSWPRFQTANPSGTINLSATKAIEVMLKKPYGFLEVNGEEDLLVIPCVLKAPLGALVFYGQPQRGIVSVPVNLTHKNRLYYAILGEA